jgi:sucrose-6F-phosphate phosphohydrolase
MDTRRLLVSDLDGTLLGDGPALARFREWLAARRGEFLLVYASGRGLTSIQALVDEGALPVPDAMITMVGTEIYDGAGRRWSGWPSRFDGFDANQVDDLLRPVAAIVPQAPGFQTTRKVSFDRVDGADLDRAGIEATLADAGVEARIVESADRFVDILPAASGKANAARHLADDLGVAPLDVLTFGDSGNDLDLFRAGFRGTIVANAQAELRDIAGPDIYHSPASFADGVLDGIHHWSSVPHAPAPPVPAP